MKIIEKIEIHRFRSISDASFEVSEMNVFSGINNSGKSNILRALNLFFNGDSSFNQKYDFLKDYNRAFTGQAGGKRATRVVLYFSKQGEAALGKPFYISRIFESGRDSTTSYHSTDPKIQAKLVKNDGNINRQFTTFLNKIEFFYIPAVRDKTFVQNLFLHFEKLIEHGSGKDFEEKMNELSEILRNKSDEISSDFERFIGLPTRAALSSKTVDLLGTVEINVKTGIEITRRTKAEGKKKENIEVNLFSSGDGILMSYLAYFLAHICKKISNKMFVWGFEEPENSLEYSKVQKIAEEFYNGFSKNAQIFITTHSPAFINLKDKDDVCFYRVYIEPQDIRQSSKIRTLEEIKNRQQSLFELGEIKSEEYKKLTKELYFVEFAKEIELAVERVASRENEILETQKKLEDQIGKASKSVLFVEGDIDTTYLIRAAEVLEKKSTIDKFEIKNCNGKGELSNIWNGFCKHKHVRESLLEKKAVLLYDCDVDIIGAKKDNIFKKSVPKIKENPIQIGIENLFPKELINRAISYKRAFIDITPEVIKIERGEEVKVPEIWNVNENEKKNLCEWICKNGNGEDFIHFEAVFTMIEKVLNGTDESESSV